MRNLNTRVHTFQTAVKLAKPNWGYVSFDKYLENQTRKGVYIVCVAQCNIYFPIGLY